MTNHPQPLLLEARDLSFATDLYEFTMAAAYHALDPMPRGTFELFVRHLPPHRNFLVFAGLEQVLASLGNFRFSSDQIDYLRGLPQFSRVAPSFFKAMAQFRFRGDVWAMPEGSLFFPNEPVLQIRGTLLEAQMVETLVLSIVNFQSAVASKAARIRLAGPEPVHLAEFGGRRAHGPQAATWVARAAYLGGFDSTSNTLAGQRIGIPVAGTMAHSFVLAFDSESAAFEHFQSVFPEHSVLLVDTFDSLAGVRHALATEKPFFGVRLDSGDLGQLALKTRELLDEGGRQDAQIFASGDLDEWQVRRLLGLKAPIDAFGVGTRLAALSDASFLGGVYKLVETEVAGKRLPKAKASAAKSTLPWRKQVYRRFQDGVMTGDLLVPVGEKPEDEEFQPLLEPVIRDGEVIASGSLEEARNRCGQQLAQLPSRLRRLGESAQPYRLEISSSLRTPED